MKELTRSIYKNHNEKLKFAVVGVINTLVDISVFMIMFRLVSLSEEYSQGIGYTCGLINSYILSKFWTFKSANKKKDISQVPKFIVVNLVTMLISMYSISFLIGTLNMLDIFAKILITPIVMVVNFLGYKLWVFKAK